eukprot:1159377-Pelagomonas_calceolata.AAC.9
MASGNVHPGCPGPPRAPPTLEFWLPSQTKSMGSFAVSEGRERQWLVLERPSEYVRLRPAALGEGTGVAAQSVVTCHACQVPARKSSSRSSS